ncbi:YfiR family protein [Pseudoalteromonas sp. T1lg65]|uniref:YfiR family protein n=1 Tax=Pseudoalteromonas sp. T1lg65 TaxID=2077101 RepID=UPI003F7ABFDB
MSQKLVLITLLLFCSVIHAKTPDQVRSAFLYQMAKFVDFPNASEKMGTRFCFFSLESGPGAELNSAQNLKINGQLIEVKLVEKSAPFTEISKSCDITYIDEQDENDILRAWTETTESGMLTVGESIEFLETGGVASLVQEGSKIRLYINKQALKNQYFVVRSRLLSVSKFHPN